MKTIEIKGSSNQKVTVVVEKIEYIQETLDDTDQTIIQLTNSKIISNEPYEKVVQLING